MKNSFPVFRQKLNDLAQLRSAFAVLSWDKDVFMPPKGSGPRSEMLGYLAGEMHDKVLSPEFRGLLGEVKAAADAGELSPDDSAIVREVWRDVSREEKLPVEFVKEITQLTSEAYHVWMDARKKKDFKLFAPYLTKIVELKRREAELVGFKQSPYDALLDTYEPYATTEEIATALGDLKNFLAPFLVKIKNSKAKVSRTALAGDFDIEKQKAFCILAAKQIGYDFDAGRLDVSAHPFSTSFHPLDARITTRYSRSAGFNAVDRRRDSRNRSCLIRTRAARSAFWHPARRGGFARYSRIAIAAVGKSGGQESRLLDLLLSRAAKGISDAAAAGFVGQFLPGHQRCTAIADPR